MFPAIPETVFKLAITVLITVLNLRGIKATLAPTPSSSE